MITSLRLENWKSFGEGEGARNVVKLAPLTLLVGPNASGKSNVLDALRFLQGAAFDLPLGDVLRGRWEGQRQVWPGIRGHVAEAARLGTTGFSLETEYRDAQADLRHSIRVRVANEIEVEEERLTEDSEDLFNTRTSLPHGGAGRTPDGVISAVHRAPSQGPPASLPYSSARSVLGQVKADPSLANRVINWTAWIRQELRNAAFFDIQPSNMHDYRPENGGELGTSGENISPVLHALASSKGRLEDIVDWLNELCAPAIESINFDRTQLREVMMFVVERGGHRISARSLSDGTLRFLGLLVALLTSPAGSLVIFEEPNVGLHPTRLRVLAELFESLVAKRGIQVLATTHSPTLLAHLSPEALGNVVAFGRDPETGWTACSRLAELPHFETLRDAKDLEHLVSTGWVEQAL